MTATALTACHAQRQTEFTILHEFPSPGVELAWRDCLARVDCPAHYNSPEYFVDAKGAAEKSRFAVLATNENRVTGVLTGIHEEGQVSCGQISRPQICVDQPADPSAALDALARGLLIEAGSAKLVSVHSWFPLATFSDYGFGERRLEGVVTLDLRQGPETLFRQLDKKRRNCIRSAMRQPMEIFQARTDGDVEDFYAVYSSWHGTARKQIDGPKLCFEFFQQRFRHPENIRMFLARFEGKAIAGLTLRFFPGGLVEYANNSSLDGFLHLRPNDLLLWRAIEWACREGFSRFSLGGAHRFLREFGGALTPIYRYRLDRTPLRQHDLREGILDWGRKKLGQMPRPVEKRVRQFLGKTRA